MIDKANGYNYSGLPTAKAVVDSLDLRDMNSDYATIGAVQERYVEFFEEEMTND